MMGAPMAPQTGMVPDPAHAGALAAMNAAIPLPAENKTGKKTKEQPKRKKAPAESEAKEKATGAGADS